MQAGPGGGATRAIVPRFLQSYSVDGALVGAAVGMVVVGATVGGRVGELVGDAVGVVVGAAVGSGVISRHVWLGVVQVPSEHWWVLAQLHRVPAPSSTCSQIPKAVVSHWCEPSLQAWRVGPAVGSAVGALEIGIAVGAGDGSSVGEGLVGAVDVGAGVVGDAAYHANVRDRDEQQYN